MFIFKRYFYWHIILGWQVFFFQFSTLKMLLHCLLPFIFFLMNISCYLVIPMNDRGFPLVLLLATFKISFLLLFCVCVCVQCNYYISWCGFLSVSYACASLSFLNIWFYSFYQIWKIFSFCFFRYFLSLPHFWKPQ